MLATNALLTVFSLCKRVRNQKELPNCVNLSNSELNIERGMLLEKKRAIY